MTRPGFQRIRCCVCHLHDERAMIACGSVREIFKTALQQVYNFKVDVIVGDVNATSTILQKAGVPRSAQFFSCRKMGRLFESNTNNHLSSFPSAADLDCCFMAFLSRRKPLGPRIMRNLWSNSSEQTQGNDKGEVRIACTPKVLKLC